MITMYSKKDCNFCTKAKLFLQKHSIEFKEYLMGTDITREEIIEQFPQMKTMPIILLDGRVIGGYTQMVEHFGGEYKRVEQD